MEDEHVLHDAPHISSSTLARNPHAPSFGSFLAKTVLIDGCRDILIAFPLCLNAAVLGLVALSCFPALMRDGRDDGITAPPGPKSPTQSPAFRHFVEYYFFSHLLKCVILLALIDFSMCFFFMPMLYSRLKTALVGPTGALGTHDRWNLEVGRSTAWDTLNPALK